MSEKIRNWLTSQPIRIKVLVFGIVMSIIPLLLISYYYYSNVKEELETRILANQKLILQNLSSEIELEFNQTFQQLQMATALNQQGKQQGFFYDLLKQNESIEEIVVTDDLGFIQKKVSRYNLNIPSQNEKWFSEDMWDKFESKSKSYGKVEFNQFDQPVMKVTIPFIEDGKQKGIGVIIQLQKIIGKISSLRQEYSGYLYLLDQDGKVIAHQDYSQIWKKRPTAISKEVLGVQSEISDLGWTLVMEQPASKAYEPINNMFRNGLYVAAIVTIIVSLISIYAGLYFTTPIIYLEKGMNYLKTGRKPTPIQLNRQDELGKLSESFNEMSDELQEKSLRLEQEKERLSVVVNGIDAGLALVTKDYKVTWMNPLLQKWIHYQDVQLPCFTMIGGKMEACEDCPITCPELDGNGNSIMKVKEENGEERIFKHRVFSLNNAMKGEGEFLVVIEDITEQKQMEEKIIQTDKLSALGLMASSFAHEVNNPLATINVFAEDLIDRLEQQDADLDEEEMALYLTKIKENTERCKKITSNLLNFSRKSNWTVTHMDINETIVNSISLVESTLKKKQIKLTTALPHHLPLLLGDSLKLMQVLVNLINNAIDAMEQSGQLDISASVEQNYVLIQVMDTGSGIKPEVLGKIFDPFYTTKPVGKGTGLGLSVCYGIIEEFGGTIQVESKVGAGTNVKVRLPVREN
jgi:signal transduction histidine kinase/HAMP domain-containing protein